MIREFRKPKLSIDEIRSFAPAVVAEQPSNLVSDRYSFIPTTSIIESLSTAGWYPTSVKQSVKTMYENTGKHMVRFQHPDLQYDQGDRVELVIVNSHDGKSSLSMFFGIFRLVCLNGAVIGREIESWKAIHVQLDYEEVQKITYFMGDKAKVIGSQIETFKNIILDSRQIKEFAEQALKLRYPMAWESPITPIQLLKPRRTDIGDSSSLWNLYNNAQENLTKGGLHGKNVDGRRVQTRGINRIDQDVKINTGLWDLAQSYISH